ncbi:MAG: YtxH domain-containing protein [Bacteroidaceae bacterium]|nr:YtxH domain-containing protein [Bacteroidaceae bacterium]
MKQTGLCIVTLLGGALMGAAIAMLVTPKTGRQMRDHIRDFISDEMEKMRCKCGEHDSHTEVAEPIK